MDAFLKMDIFFVVATLGVVAISVLGTIVLWRISRVMKNVEHISDQVAAESDTIRLDLAEMRGDIRRGKGKIKSLMGFLDRTAKRAKDN